MFPKMKYTRRILLWMIAIVGTLYLLLSGVYVLYARNKQERLLEGQYTDLVHMATETATLQFNECSQLSNVLHSSSALSEYLTSDPSVSVADLVGYRYELAELSYRCHTLYPSLQFQIYALEEKRSYIEFVLPYSDLPAEVASHFSRSSSPLLSAGQDNSVQFSLYTLLETHAGIQPIRTGIIRILLPREQLMSSFSSMTEHPLVTLTMQCADGKTTLLHDAPPLTGAWVSNYRMESHVQYNGEWFITGSEQADSENPGLCSFYAVFQARMDLRTFVLMLGLLAGVLTLLVCLVQWISRRLLRQVETIVVNVNGAPLSHVIDSIDEFDYIRKCLTQMVRHIDEQHALSLRQAVEAKELETQLLQDLINPHFLYNTLEGIRYVCHDGQTDRVINSMIQFYRLVLNRGSLYLTVEKEIAMIEAYAQIQRFAYESDFRLEISLPQQLRDVPIMKFLLQPFVENAILHGIDKRGRNGCITIDAQAEDGKLLLLVQDNGCGMATCQLQALMSDPPLDGPSGGYGIYNVRRRIQNLYGADHGVQIDSAPGKGTQVRILLPLQTDAQTLESGEENSTS